MYINNNTVDPQLALQQFERRKDSNWGPPGCMLLTHYSRPVGTYFDSLNNYQSHTVQTIEGLLYYYRNSNTAPYKHCW